MSDDGPRLAVYWRCYGCSLELTLATAADIGAVCCPGCGMTLLLPGYGPVSAPCTWCGGMRTVSWSYAPGVPEDCVACGGTGLGGVE